MRDPFKPSFGVRPTFTRRPPGAHRDLCRRYRRGSRSNVAGHAFHGTERFWEDRSAQRGQEEAKRRSWLVIQETAIPGLINRLTGEHLPGMLAQYDAKAVRRHLSGVTFGKAGVTWTSEDIHRIVPGFRNQLFLLEDLLSENGSGVLISVDEVGNEAREELRN